MEAAVEQRLVETKFGLLVPRHQFVERQTVATFPVKCLS
jgi:hypothetical protein